MKKVKAFYSFATVDTIRAGIKLREDMVLNIYTETERMDSLENGDIIGDVVIETEQEYIEEEMSGFEDQIGEMITNAEEFGSQVSIRGINRHIKLRREDGRYYGVVGLSDGELEIEFKEYPIEGPLDVVVSHRTDEEIEKEIRDIVGEQEEVGQKERRAISYYKDGYSYDFEFEGVNYKGEEVVTALITEAGSKGLIKMYLTPTEILTKLKGGKTVRVSAGYDGIDLDKEEVEKHITVDKKYAVIVTHESFYKDKLQVKLEIQEDGSIKVKGMC